MEATKIQFEERRDRCKEKYEKCKEKREKCRDKHDNHDKCKDRWEHKDSHHIHELEKTITALADSLANLGRGGHLNELLRIIHCPGWTSKAEVAFVNAILDHINVDVRALDRLQADLVEAARKVDDKHK